MKSLLIENFYKIFDIFSPQRICEIGTHDAKSASQICLYLLKKGIDVDYTGYDLFEEAHHLTHNYEINGKGTGRLSVAQGKFRLLREKFPKFNYKLIPGNTLVTLSSPLIFDFAFIDGGHSYETVKHDFLMLKNTPIIIFDDYDIPDVARAVNSIDNTFLLNVKSKKNIKKQAIRFNNLSYLDKLPKDFIINL